MKFSAFIQRLVNKRLAFSFLLFAIFYLIFAIPKASAQTNPNYSPNPYLNANTNPDVPKNLHTFSQTVVIEVIAALSCQITGVDPVNSKQKCLGIDQETGKIGFVENGGGAVNVMASLIGSLYTPPIRVTEYADYLASNFGITKKALAADPKEQGTGFQSLRPLMGLWSIFRNIVYVILTLVFLVIGIAIMLRIKIDPRTVMTIENQIPKIIIGLVMVTFSFAIAGFLIDFMWVLIYLVFNIIGEAAQDLPNAQQIWNTQANLQGTNTLELFNGLIGIFDLTWNVSGSIGRMIVDLLGGSGLESAFAVGGILKGLFGSIAFLIVGIAVLFALVRVWFSLIMAYVNILLDVVIAPFWVLAGLIPGSSISFGGWVRDILGNLVAFPAVIALFLVGKVFKDAFSVPQTEGQFLPPLLGNPGSNNSIGFLIGFGIILLSPKIVDYLKAALKAPKFDMTPIAQALGVGTRYPMSVGKTTGGTIKSSREFIVRDVAGGQPVYGRRDLGRSVLGRIFGG